MGGSLGLALIQKGLAESVWGLGRNEGRLENARKAGVITHSTTDQAEAAKDAEIIVVGLPVERIPAAVVGLSSSVSQGAVITDMGSVKEKIVTEIEAGLGDKSSLFIGSHPMCGSEKQGFESARVDLYEGATCAVTPTERSSNSACEKVVSFWESVGCRTLQFNPSEHDRIVARTSHVPHITASALCNMLDFECYSEKRDGMVATGFMGATRTATGDVENWLRIFLDNDKYVLKALGDLETSIGEVRRFLANEDEEGLKDWLERAALTRNRLADERAIARKREAPPE